MPDAAPLLRPRDVAKMLSLSMPRIYQLAASRQIATVKMGGAIRFYPEDVESYLREHYRERRTGNVDQR